MKSKPISIIDILGMSSAALCLVHCLFFPVITLFSMTLPHAAWIDICFAAISIIMFFKVVISQSKIYIKWILGVSITILMAGIIAEVFFSVESVMVVLGGFGMIVGHALNYRNHSNHC